MEDALADFCAVEAAVGEAYAAFPNEGGLDGFQGFSVHHRRLEEESGGKVTEDVRPFSRRAAGILGEFFPRHFKTIPHRGVKLGRNEIAEDGLDQAEREGFGEADGGEVDGGVFSPVPGFGFGSCFKVDGKNFEKLIEIALDGARGDFHFQNGEASSDFRGADSARKARDHAQDFPLAGDGSGAV